MSLGGGRQTGQESPVSRPEDHLVTGAYSSRAAASLARPTPHPTPITPTPPGACLFLGQARPAGLGREVWAADNPAASLREAPHAIVCSSLPGKPQGGLKRTKPLIMAPLVTMADK